MSEIENLALRRKKCWFPIKLKAKGCIIVSTMHEGENISMKFGKPEII